MQPSIYGSSACSLNCVEPRLMCGECDRLRDTFLVRHQENEKQRGNAAANREYAPCDSLPCRRNSIRFNLGCDRHIIFFPDRDESVVVGVNLSPSRESDHWL